MSPLFTSLRTFLASSIGKKILVAVTGAVLVLFVLGHMIGNLLIYAGPDALNEYGRLLHTLLHGAGLWIARAVLLTCVAVHIVLTVQLTRENRAARGSAYGCQATLKASRSSRIMILSGLTLLAFIIFHLLHFTVRAGPYREFDAMTATLDGETVHNVHRMVVAGFSSVPVSAFYIIAMGLLCSHLSHGVASMFQTLGLATDRTRPALTVVSRAFAAIIFVGNCSIPVAVLCGLGS